MIFRRCISQYPRLNWIETLPVYKHVHKQIVVALSSSLEQHSPEEDSTVDGARQNPNTCQDGQESNAICSVTDKDVPTVNDVHECEEKSQ